MLKTYDYVQIISFINFILEAINVYTTLSTVVTWNHFFVKSILKIVTWNYHCLQRIIIIGYLKPYDCEKCFKNWILNLPLLTKDYHN